MRIKLKYLPTLSLTLITAFSAGILSIPRADAATTATKTASVTVIPACYFTNDSDSFTTNLSTTSGVTTNTEALSKSAFTFTCGSPQGFSIQAVGFSPNTSGGDGVEGNTVLYNPSGSIPTGTSGNNSRWAFRISSATSSSSYTIQGNYGNYSAIPNTAVNIISYPGVVTVGTPVTGSMRTDYEVYTSGDQAPGTYTGAVKYILAANS